MNLNWLRLALGALWLAIGLALLLRDSIGLNWLSDRYSPENLNLGGGLGIAFAIWNTIRWFGGRRSPSKVRPGRTTPLLPKNTEQRPFEYNPELDFLKPETESPESK